MVDAARRAAFRLLAFALPAVVILLAGCGNADFRSAAIGPDAQITVVIDSARWNGPVGEALREQLGAYIQTLPGAEASFDLQPAHITSNRDFEQIQGFKNLVFVAPLSDTTNAARFIQSILSPEARQAILDGGSAMVPRTDVWRRRQQVVYVTAATPEALSTALIEDGQQLRQTFNRVLRERLHRSMFDKGRQPDLEAYLMDRHGFAVDAQHDFVIATDTLQFIWMRRILSDTWRSFFIYYEENADPAKLRPEWIYAARDALSRNYLQGTLGGWVEVDHRLPLISEEINFLGRYAIETRGLWHMVGEENGEKFEFGMAGPFLSYAFYDEPTGRLYLLDGMVFAPNFDKREFLRQMEVIAYTFRTRQDVAQQQEVAAQE